MGKYHDSCGGGVVARLWCRHPNLYVSHCICDRAFLTTLCTSGNLVFCCANPADNIVIDILSPTNAFKMVEVCAWDSNEWTIDLLPYLDREAYCLSRSVAWGNTSAVCFCYWGWDPLHGVCEPLFQCMHAQVLWDRRFLISKSQRYMLCQFAHNVYGIRVSIIRHALNHRDCTWAITMNTFLIPPIQQSPSHPRAIQSICNETT